MPTLDYYNIGRKIRKRRLSLEITQKVVANRLDTDPSHICNIECGRSGISLNTLILIANTLECSVDYFLSGEYTFHTVSDASMSERALYNRVCEKISECDFSKRERLLKLLNLILH